MRLIDEEVIQGLRFRFYDGIDFNWIKDFPKDGKEGFIVFFIESWIGEVKKHQRESTINRILKEDSSSQIDLNEIQNDFVSIYQLNGIELLEMKSTIKTKIENNLANYIIKKNFYDEDDYH